MKVYKYQVTVAENMLSYTQGETQKQTRIYIPKKGVLGFRSKYSIDFYNEDEKSIRDAEKAILKKSNATREIDLPEDLISKVILFGMQLNSARKGFDEATRSLIDLI